MRRTQRILLTSLLGSLCTAEALAQTGPLDARAIKPAVMLLVDTSGSMERLPATAGTDESPLPTCTGNTASDSLNKNRWALTIEALTGSFQSYTCRTLDRSGTGFVSTDYDYGYYLPHIDFGTAPPQNTDGILDSFANRVKFGLMTFDGIGTTINGETLVPYHKFFDDTAFMTQVDSAQGMYSYGRIGRLSFPGCEDDYGVNAGARGPGTHPGALISVGNSESNTDILTINQSIQNSLLRVRPFGGTPIPAMLDDLRYYLENHTDVRSTSDPFYSCRERTAILITDGAPDALFRDSRFQCEQGADSGAHASCATNSHPDGGVGDAGTASLTTQCECPYQEAHEIAGELLRDGLLKKLIVVAYNIQDPSALGILETIAAAGWPRDTSGRDLEPALGTNATYPYLVRANGPVELRNMLNSAMRGGQSGVTSRSVPISVNTGDATSGPDSKRFDVTAGFELGEDEDQPWRGYLYRRRITCGGADGTTVNDQERVDPNLGDDFGYRLNSRSPATRDLFTVVPQAVGDVNGTLRNAAYVPVPVYDSDDANFDRGRLPTSYDTHNDRRPDGSNFSTADQPAADGSMNSSQAISSNLTNPANMRVAFNNSLTATLFGSSVTDDGRRRIVDYVRGDSRPDRVLADIYHSNPIALLPLNSASTSRFADINAAYSTWLRQIIAPGSGARYGADGRPGVVFVGTNDGVLHAFNLDDWEGASGDQYNGGHELWGFIPPALFGKMAAAAAPAHQDMFDGTPEVKDVVLQRRPDVLGPPIFRTVLVSSVRGAPAYVALDVTHPETPVFLWQVSFADVGETIGNAAVTQVEVQWLGERQQRAVAILPGGRGAAAATCPTTGQALVSGRTRAFYPTGNTRNVRCWQRRGRALYVVDVATGQLLQEFGPEHFPSPLTGSVVVDAAGVGTASAAYFYDEDGVLWRLSMVGPDPNQWQAAPLFDMFAGVAAPTGLQTWQIGRPPQYAPALTRDRLGNLVILAGSGDADNPLDNATQRVVSLTEKRVPTSDGQIGGTLVHNWEISLDYHESVTGPLTVFEDTVYFGTFTSQAGANQCALGVSHMYGAHAFDPADPTTRPGPPQPKLIATNATSTDPPVLREQFPGTSLILGLTVTRQPICRNSLRLINAVTQQATGGPSGGGLYQLRGMMAGGGSNGQNVTGAATTEMPSRDIQVTHPSSVSAWAASVE